MEISTHKHYDKAWAKLGRKQQAQVIAALRLLVTDAANAKLRVHQLRGEYFPQYSLSAAGDLRVHYLKLSDTHILLMTVGTHAQLYG